ncbi:GntR family transcriptional regulator [Pseudonocardia nematodicida]|uniref:GntR family transcriptional regulator n=1 Tax=Pseudonocardia nematodicida TaxID=1206997 RepID=A0ABV1KGU7_9PSEU
MSRPAGPDDHSSYDGHDDFRRAARERAARQNRVRVPSVLGAHGALVTSLRTGEICVNDRLDEGDIGARFSVSRNAVRSALRLLATEGVVSRSPRAGTVVTSGMTEIPIDNGLAWNVGTDPERQVVVLDQRWVASSPVIRRYLRTTATRVHASEILDLHVGNPILLYTRYTLEEGRDRPLVPRSDDGRFEEVFARAYGSPLARIDSWIEAGSADDRTAAQLRTPAGTPLIVKSRVLWSGDGVPREFSITHYPAARVALSTATDGAGPDDDPVVESVAVPEVRTGGVDAAPDLLRTSAANLRVELRAAIREGIVRPGDRLVEDELARSFGAGRSTVRQALTHLAHEGTVTRTAGSTLAGPIAAYRLNSGVPHRETETGRHRSRHLTSVTIPAAPFVAHLLAPPDGRVVLDEFLSVRDDGHATLYLRYTTPSAEPRPLVVGRRDEFREGFRRAYGRPPGRVVTVVHAVTADADAARRLRVAPDSILLLSERVLFDADGAVREFSHSYRAAAHACLATRTVLPT